MFAVAEWVVVVVVVVVVVAEVVVAGVAVAVLRYRRLCLQLLRHHSDHVGSNLVGSK